MLFDNVTLKKGMDFAAQLYAVHRQLSPIDLRDILLGCFSGLPIAGKNQCDHIRKNIVSPSLDGASPVLMLIAALSEMDRLTGWRQLLPIELADLMSHMLPGDEDAPWSATARVRSSSPSGSPPRGGKSVLLGKARLSRTSQPSRGGRSKASALPARTRQTRGTSPSMIPIPGTPNSARSCASSITNPIRGRWS